MRVSVIVFPGSNCDHDAEHVYGQLGHKVTTVWHRDTDLAKPDLVVLPGGFAYGDYLRTGAMAKVSPIMPELKKFAAQGGPVLGICNGFQILCEVGLLPGVLLKNIQLKFLSRFVHLKVEQSNTFFTQSLKKGSIITCPIAHGEGNYFADAATLSRLEDEGQVIFRYVSPSGQVDAGNLEWNPNGAVNSIAGICNPGRNVLGLMPHPERASEKLIGFVGQASGLGIFGAAA